MTKEEYHFFLHNRLKQHCILGNDYYRTNEHRVFADGHTDGVGRGVRLHARSPGNITTATACR